jgi:hypothetical protein
MSDLSMSGNTKWEHVQVHYAITPPLSRDFFDRFEADVREAIRLTETAVPGALSMIPENGFLVRVSYHHALIHVNLVDRSLPYPTSLRRERRYVASTSDFWKEDAGTAQYAGFFEEVAVKLARDWPGWLEWRIRRRGARPEWLVALIEHSKSRAVQRNKSGRCADFV